MNKDKIENLIMAVCSVIRHASTGEKSNELVELTLNKCRLLAETIGSNVPFKHFKLVCQWFNDLLVAMGVNASVQCSFVSLGETVEEWKEAQKAVIKINNFDLPDEPFGEIGKCSKELAQIICHVVNDKLEPSYMEATVSKYDFSEVYKIDKFLLKQLK